MGIHYQKSNVHWNYFLSIERDFENLSRYIEFSELNNSTFSIELARLIMASAQEVDVIMKKLCKLVDNNSGADSIGKYKIIINQNLRQFKDEKVFLPRFGMHSQPWLNWNTADLHPEWWNANNKIKHQRSDYFESANLKNAFNSIGGLLITTLYYYKQETEKERGKKMKWMELTGMLLPKTVLFRLHDYYYYGDVVAGEMEW